MRYTHKMEFYRKTGTPGELEGGYLIQTHEAVEPLEVTIRIDESWEHASVHLPSRPPTHKMMNLVRQLFWAERETVMQVHAPQESYYRGRPAHTIHLFKARRGQQLPPLVMSALKAAQ